MKWHYVFLMIALTCSHYLRAQDFRRCVREDGTIVFTDHVCAVQEHEKTSQLTAIAPINNKNASTKARVNLPPSCNTSPEELLYAVRSAINMNDVNQLAKQYHWPGVTDAQAEQLMNRLELVVNSPLIDIQLLYPTNAVSETLLTNTDVDFIKDGRDEPADTYSNSTPRLQAPYALRVLQYISNTNSQTQSSTFRLQRHFDCWWIRY
jgi:hypothetical protein